MVYKRILLKFASLDKGKHFLLKLKLAPNLPTSKKRQPARSIDWQARIIKLSASYASFDSPPRFFAVGRSQRQSLLIKVP